MGRTFKSGRVGLARVAAAVALAAGLASLVSVQGAGASGAPTNGLHTRGLKPAASTSNLIDHGGKVLPASNTYVIFWGPSSAWQSDVVGGIQDLFNGFNSSAYLGIAKQYMRIGSISSSLAGVAFDPTAPPNKVNASTLGNEVLKVKGQFTTTTPDPNGIYLVYTSNFPRGGNFCAWHSLTTSGSTTYSVAYMPNTGGVAGCDPGNLLKSTKSEDLRSLANVSAHEFMEAVTDTLPTNGSYGWLDSSGSEIGDKCAWQFDSKAPAVKLSNGTVWQLQEEWDNSITGCNQGA